MAVLTLNNLSARVGRITKRTDLSTEIADAILERANYLLHLDEWPFDRAYKSMSLVVGTYRYALPSAFAIPWGITNFTSDKQRTWKLLDQHTFDAMFPKPDERGNGEPAYYCIKNDEFWTDRGADATDTIRLDYQMIPLDATLGGISAEMTDMAKLAIVNYAASDIFEQIGNVARQDRSEKKGDMFVRALQKRYETLAEKNSGFISPQDIHNYVETYFPDDEWKRLGW